MCDDKFQFNKKVIFKDVVTFLSKVVYGHKSILSVAAAVKDTYLWDVMNDYFF